MRRLEQDHGQAVSERLVQAMNAHDLEAHVACFRDDYRSDQPAHPARTFTGREQVRQNWSKLFESIPDFRAGSSASPSSATKSGASGFGTGPRKMGRP
jgi:ketosteroid isomerase-like protein